MAPSEDRLISSKGSIDPQTTDTLIVDKFSKQA